MLRVSIDKNIKKPKQYSKTWMTRWQLFVMWWLSVFFVTDIYYNKCEHLETLCITLVTSIIATIIPYYAKSYFETKEEKRSDNNNYTDTELNESN